MARYLLAEEKLWKDLKLITLQDQQWHLRPFDHNYMGVDLSIETICYVMSGFNHLYLNNDTNCFIIGCANPKQTL